MTGLTVRNLHPSIKATLRLRAAQHGWSVEQEVRFMLQAALQDQPRINTSFVQRIHQRFQAFAADDLPIPKDHLARTAPNFAADA